MASQHVGTTKGAKSMVTRFFPSAPSVANSCVGNACALDIYIYIYIFSIFRHQSELRTNVLRGSAGSVSVLIDFATNPR